MPDNTHNPVLGIDLGTTYSAIARWDGRGPEVYQNLAGLETTQSVVYLDPLRGDLVVGDLAWEFGLRDPQNMIVGVKRYMDDASHLISLAGQTFTPIELSAKILKRLYADVEEKFPEGVFRSRGTVVTIPYYFKTHQCNNTELAAKMADIGYSGMIQEPIAASLSYAWQLAMRETDRDISENILVFDLGGGTFDLTLFHLEKTRDRLLFEVKATGGHERLGGMDFDEALSKHLLEEKGIYLEELPEIEQWHARQKMLPAIRAAKERLTAVPKWFVTVPDVVPGRGIDSEITRERFNGLLEPYVEEIERIVDKLWYDARVEPEQVDRVISVGGSSKIPQIRAFMKGLTHTDRVWGDNNPSLCVAEGAAMYAAYKDDPEIFGLKIDIRTRTSHALGIETVGGRFTVLIPANRLAPATEKHEFKTTADNQTRIDVNVYQGAKLLAKDNTLVGTIPITGLPPRPRGEVKAFVTFSINSEQQLSVVVEVAGHRTSATFKPKSS